MTLFTNSTELTDYRFCFTRWPLLIKINRSWPCSGSATSLWLGLWEWIWTPAEVRQVCSTASVAPWPNHRGVECQPFPLVCEVVIPADLWRAKSLFPSLLFVSAVCFGREENLLLGFDHKLVLCYNQEGWAFCWRRNRTECQSWDLSQMIFTLK